MAEDIEIKCAEKGCTAVRIHTVRDQEFYAQKGYDAPKRCRPHSQARRAAHNEKQGDREQEERDERPRDKDHRGVAPHFPDQEDDRNIDW